jgi:phytoene dehydrogenase-like protein
MGNLVSQLEAKAKIHGAQILLNHKAVSISPKKNEDDLVKVVFSNGEEIHAKHLLFAAAPQILHSLVDVSCKPVKSLEGSQMKINMLVKKLPRLKSGINPSEAFAGTFHINESYTQLQSAYEQASRGEIPDVIPGEIYCHTLSDASILSPELAAAGFHTLTLFVLHTPATLFDSNHDAVKAEVLSRILVGFNSYLVDPIEECLAINEDGSYAIEAKTPLELEKDVMLPRGNIFHKDLSWPFREDHEEPQWGVETEFDGVLLIGAGARRGGGVSGIPGRNGANAIAEKLGFTL